MQKILKLSKEWSEDIEAKRDWVRNHYEPDSVNKYDTVEGKLILLDAILSSDWIERDETVKLQSLGITLGDIIVQDMGFQWIEVKDEYGNDPAVQFPGTSIIVFPMTMLSKRIEAGETVDIYKMYADLKGKLQEIKRKTNLR